MNMRIANCTTAAQFFHLLRRQAKLLLEDPLPLVILTPKSLLRHPQVASTPRELAEGRFRMVINDGRADSAADAVRRMLICSGKVYVDLVGTDTYAERPDIAICRLEQLYPVPRRDLRAAIERYPNLDEVVWVQEEPENMGVWEFIRAFLVEAADGLPVRRVTRPRSASPAEGSSSRHNLNQQALLEQAFGAAPTADSRASRTRERQDAGQLTSAKR
jgi:2-oxoglutarate dehydrogenase E1 component